MLSGEQVDWMGRIGRAAFVLLFLAGAVLPRLAVEPCLLKNPGPDESRENAENPHLNGAERPRLSGAGRLNAVFPRPAEPIIIIKVNKDSKDSLKDSFKEPESLIITIRPENAAEPRGSEAEKPRFNGASGETAEKPRVCREASQPGLAADRGPGGHPPRPAARAGGESRCNHRIWTGERQTKAEGRWTMETDAAYTNLLYWKLKLWIYLLAHRREIEIRAGAGDPGAMEILALQDLAGEYPTRGSLQALLVALDEYRCALLN